MFCSCYCRQFFSHFGYHITLVLGSGLHTYIFFYIYLYMYLFRIRANTGPGQPFIHIFFLNIFVFFDFSLTVKAAPHECVIRTGQP